MKITKTQLKALIVKEIAAVQVGDYMSDMGDAKMTPEAHLFFYRGMPSPSMKAAVESIISELEEGGIKLPQEKNVLVDKIIMEIRNAVREGV